MVPLYGRARLASVLVLGRYGIPYLLVPCCGRYGIVAVAAIPSESGRQWAEFCFRRFEDFFNGTSEY